MDKIKQRQNRGYLIAGIGTLVALLAILLLPYAIVTYSDATGRTSQYIAMTLNATALTPSSVIAGLGIPGFSQIQSQGTLWLLPILAVAALVLTGLLVLRDHPFGKGINAPLAKQRRWGNYGLIGIAALSVLIQIVLFANLTGQIQSSVNASNSGSGIKVSTVGHLGFWLFLLGMAAVAAGAIFLLVQENKQTQAAQAVPNMPGGQSYQPWQSPAPLDPYSQPYPPQQSQPYPPQQVQSFPPQQQEPYPPQQPQQAQPYPPQQWPSSNPPQSPYPPGQ